MTSAGRMPDFVIAGAMRSGTTSLARWLGDHPDIHMAAVKEVHYFDRNYELGPGWYEEHFAGAGGVRAVGEATPNYLYHRTAMERMAADLPGVRLVILLRDPVARAYSHYHHRKARGEEHLSFDDAINAEPRRLARADELTKAHVSYVDRGRYLSQLQLVLSLFPRDSVLIHLFEDLRDDPKRVFAATAIFLGVDASAVPITVGRAVNGYQQFRSRTLRRLSRRLPPPAARIAGRLNRVDADGYQPMSAHAHRVLVDAYSGERVALGNLLGRNLDEVWD